MNDIAIRVENLGKRYRIGTAPERYKTLRDTITAGINAPFQRLWRGASNSHSSSASNIIWALRDISFDVQRGKVLGVVGRNGAGKSTLLKILSRVTEPTEGSAEIHGRVGSLLEVGTGFHPRRAGGEKLH